MYGSVGVCMYVCMHEIVGYVCMHRTVCGIYVYAWELYEEHEYAYMGVWRHEATCWIYVYAWGCVRNMCVHA